MTDQRDSSDENPFRVNSPRNVLLRARERWHLISEWMRARREESHRVLPHEAQDEESRH